MNVNPNTGVRRRTRPWDSVSWWYSLVLPAPFILLLLVVSLQPSGRNDGLVGAGGRVADPSTEDPVGRFVDEMNAYATQHGMTGSHFSNAVGIDSIDHYVTAWDMLRATRRLLADPVLAEIAAMPGATMTIDGPNPRELYLVSANQFVLNGESFGVKTGSTDSAGGMSAERNVER